GVSHTAMLNRLVGLTRTASGLDMAPVGTDLSRPPPRPIANDDKYHPGPSPKKQYDEFQQAAIEAPTPALITAGPGSGKTSTLIGRIEYMIHTLSIMPQHILALTFSRKAAQEMEERLLAIL